MATKRCYEVSYPSILLYYNILGVDIRTVNINYIENEVSELSDLTPKELYNGLPEISQLINREWLEIIKRLCTSFGYSMNDDTKKLLYNESVIGILNTATSLNLMEEGRENYILHFYRLSVVLLLVLRELNKMGIDDVILFNDDIKHSLSNQIFKRAKLYPWLSAFCYLAMNDNPEIEDYKMFGDKNSVQIKEEYLYRLIAENVHNNKNYQYLKRDFKRLSYKETEEINIRK